MEEYKTFRKQVRRKWFGEKLIMDQAIAKDQDTFSVNTYKPRLIVEVLIRLHNFQIYLEHKSKKEVFPLIWFSFKPHEDADYLLCFHQFLSKLHHILLLVKLIQMFSSLILSATSYVIFFR